MKAICFTYENRNNQAKTKNELAASVQKEK